MKAELRDFTTDRGRLLFLAFCGLESRLEYPNCEGKDDKKRIIEAFEKELAGYDL